MSEDQAGDDGEDLLRKHARLLQEEIGIPTDFLEGLVEERDDWSFVIKLTALIEGALTHLLTETLGRPELRDVFAFVDLGHTKAGKIVFASALNVLDPSAKTLIRKLLEMRNVFAHDVRSVALTIPEYARSLKPGEQKAVIKAFSYYTTGESIAIGKHPAVPTEQFTRENLRLAVWFSAMNLN